MTEAHRFSGGRVHTGRRTVESLLVQDGRVVVAGTEEEARRASPPDTEVIPLEGRVVLPGLIDAHLHLAEMTRVREGLDLTAVRSIGELQERLEQWGHAHPKGPVVGRGWSGDQLEGRQDPTAPDLDRVISDRPVILYHASGHSAVLNRAALAAVGFSDATNDSPGSRFGRDSDGSLNGMVYERALDPVGRMVSGADPPDPAALARTVRLVNAAGLTTVGSMNTTPEEFRALEQALRTRPTLRILCYGRPSRWSDFTATEWQSSESGHGVSLVGMKAFTDGAFGPRTAWLAEPYADSSYEVGVPALRGSELAAFLDRCREQRCAAALHAIGDAALGEALHAFERHGGAGPRRPASSTRRWSLPRSSASSIASDRPSWSSPASSGPTGGSGTDWVRPGPVGRTRFVRCSDGGTTSPARATRRSMPPIPGSGSPRPSTAPPPRGGRRMRLPRRP